MATLKDIAAILVKNHQLEQGEADAFLSAVTETILDGLRNDRVVKVKGFGVFKLTSVKDRESINVNTGERVLISGHDKITFTPDAVMRDIVNKPFAQFETVDLLDGVNFDDMPDVELEEEVAKISESADYQEEPLNVIPQEEPLNAMPLVESETPEVETETEIETKVEELVENTQEKQSPIDEVVEEKVGVENKAEEVQKSVEEAEITVASEAVVEPETIKEPQMLIGKTPETIVEQTADQDESDTNDDESSYFDEDDEMVECKKMFIIYAVIINIIVAALFFILGYFAHSKNLLGIENEERAQIDSIIEAGKRDTIVSQHVTPQTPEKVEKNDKPMNNVEKAENKEEINADDYNKDARVRTGAYRIVGTASTITVHSGQTIKSIAKQTLGDGMECYIEVYNGIKNVTAGQKIKIPKLQLKKKAKK